ncbi:MAG: hypothetical protein ACOC7V_03750 [Spirochaetota bacterium]
MKRTIFLAAMLLTTVTLFAGPQFRVAANALTPLETVPQTVEQWDEAVRPSEQTLTGWHWEVLLDRLGFGMHYGVRFFEREADGPYFVNWKGDFFVSYHPMGGGAPVDPFMEVGWGNVGNARVESVHDDRYPDWEDRVHDGTATELALYTYAAAGLALDLNGLLLGARLAYLPTELANPVPDRSVGYYDLGEFEFGIFGGVALGSHKSWRRDRHRW